MRFDIVMITNGSRPRLLEQSLWSLHKNSANWSQHHLTLVMDGCAVVDVCKQAGTVPNRIIINPERQGASRSRNIGAASTPEYLRQDAVMFLDDDIWMAPGWDMQLTELMHTFRLKCLLSGHAHPFNHTINAESSTWQDTTVLSTVHFMMVWQMWDAIGFWAEPGGAGGSEDVDYCKRAVEKFNTTPLILTRPQCVLHTGIGSTTGNKLIGWEQVMENNRKLEKIHGVEHRVTYE